MFLILASSDGVLQSNFTYFEKLFPAYYDIAISLNNLLEREVLSTYRISSKNKIWNMDIDVLKRDYYLHSYLNGKQIKGLVIEEWANYITPIKNCGYEE